MPELDGNKIQLVANNVTRNSITINKMIDDTVNYYCKQLDELLVAVRNVLDDDVAEFTTEEFERIALKIPTYLYFISSGQEYVGVKQDVSKLTADDVFNKVFMTYVGKVSDKNVVAETESFSENIIKIVNTRAYKIIDAKIKAAYELLNSVKKIINRKNNGEDRE